MKREEKKRIVLIDPKTGNIIYDRRGKINALQKKIREAALLDRKSLNDKRWNISKNPKPDFNEDQSVPFFNEISELIFEYKALIPDNKGNEAEIKTEISEKLERAEKRIIEIIRDLGIKHQKKSRTLFANKTINSLLDKLQTELRTETEKCLNTPLNRMEYDVNEFVFMNPQSDLWRERRNELIKKIVILYNKYTPMKKNTLQISHNLALILHACGISAIGMEALKKHIAAMIPR